MWECPPRRSPSASKMNRTARAPPQSSPAHTSSTASTTSTSPRCTVCNNSMRWPTQADVLCGSINQREAERGSAARLFIPLSRSHFDVHPAGAISAASIWRSLVLNNFVVRRARCLTIFSLWSAFSVHAHDVFEHLLDYSPVCLAMYLAARPLVRRGRVLASRGLK